MDRGVVCITGKLKSFKTKAQAGTALVNLGYIVKSSLTKDVTILVNESGTKSFFPKVEGRTERFGTRYRYDGLVKGEQGCETGMMASKKEKNA